MPIKVLWAVSIPGAIDGGRDTLNGRTGTAVTSLGAPRDGKALIGGIFSMVNGMERWRVARFVE